MPEQPDTAGNRAQPYYDPAGISLGSLTLLPSITATSSWDSNVFARGHDVVADSIATLGMAATVKSDRPGRTWSLRADARLRRYAQLQRQNDENYSSQAQFAWDFGAATHLTGSAQFSRATVSRGTFENGLQVGGPLRQSRLNLDVGVLHRINRISIDVGTSYLLTRFDDVSLDDGTRLDQSFRNGSRAGGLLGVSYEVRPQLALQVRGTLDKFTYSNDSATSRDATAFSVTGGGRLEVTRLFYVQLGAGLRRHNFKNALFADISGLALTGRARWYPTPLLSMSFDLTQSTTTSTFDAVSAVTATTAAFGADYEIRRNIVASATVTVTQEDYGRVSGSAKRYELSSQAVWKVNRSLRLTGRANYERRASSIGSLIPQFDAFRFLLSASLTR